MQHQCAQEDFGKLYIYIYITKCFAAKEKPLKNNWYDLFSDFTTCKTFVL